MIETCQLCPLPECHELDETQLNRAVNSRNTSIKCPLILGRILSISDIVDGWAGDNKRYVMAVKWMDRYCNNMIDRIEFLDEAKIS